MSIVLPSVNYYIESSCFIWKFCHHNNLLKENNQSQIVNIQNVKLTGRINTPGNPPLALTAGWQLHATNPPPLSFSLSLYKSNVQCPVQWSSVHWCRFKSLQLQTTNPLSFSLFGTIHDQCPMTGAESNLHWSELKADSSMPQIPLSPILSFSLSPSPSLPMSNIHWACCCEGVVIILRQQFQSKSKMNPFTPPQNLAGSKCAQNVAGKDLMT